jgi:hypothetical protein
LSRGLTHSKWKKRNEALHKVETSAINKETDNELDQQIDDIYTDLLNLLRARDGAFFKRKKIRITT